MPTPALDRACKIYVDITTCNKPIADFLDNLRLPLSLCHARGPNNLHIHVYEKVPVYFSRGGKELNVLDEIRTIMADQLRAVVIGVVGTDVSGRLKPVTKENEPEIRRRSLPIGNYTVSTGYDDAILTHRPGMIRDAIWHGVF